MLDQTKISFRQIVASFCTISLFLRAVTSVLVLIQFPFHCRSPGHSRCHSGRSPKSACKPGSTQTQNLVLENKSHHVSLLPPETALQQHPRKSSVPLNSQLLASQHDRIFQKGNKNCYQFNFEIHMTYQSKYLYHRTPVNCSF